LNVLDLFSGIGGFSLGLEEAGMRTIGFCEVDPFCHAVLRRKWPGVHIHNDIRKLNGADYAGRVDVICGGYPCQPFSVAGSRRGAADERHLWPEMFRLIRQIRPRYVIAENVAGHIDLGFDEVASSLESEGFTVWPFDICASAVDADHRRERIWIIAHANGERLQGGDGELPQDQRTGTKLPALLSPFSSEAELFSQLPASVICGKDDGIPHRTHRLRALGNSIVPQIASIIGQAVIRFDNSALNNTHMSINHVTDPHHGA